MSEVLAADWLAGVPGTTLVGRDDGEVLIELEDGANDQLVLDAARRAGRVRRFEPARPTLAELFREVVERGASRAQPASSRAASSRSASARVPSRSRCS
jgi:ABC-type uncharacterized transport system ATPase subunit